MPETQPRTGHLRGVSVNDTAKTGRPIPTETQPRVGHLRQESVNEEKRGGRMPPPLEKRGYGQAKDDPQPPAPRRVNDHVRPTEGVSY